MLMSGNKLHKFMSFSLRPLGYIFAFVFLSILIVSCSSGKYIRFEKKINPSLTSRPYESHFLGFLLFDPETKDTLYARNSQKYFTPASNTKIFTLYTALKLLPNSVPSLKYIQRNDTLFMEGTGDPSLLHPYFKDSTALTFLRGHENIAFSPHNFYEEKFGPGWAWEDYQYSYSPERSALPLYGNVAMIYKEDTLHISPDYFKDSVVPRSDGHHREITENTFYFDPVRQDTLLVPYLTNPSLTHKLLGQLLDKGIVLVDQMPPGPKETLYSIPSDSLYQRMMYESDNFLAEQILLLASTTLSDTLNSKKVRDYALEHFLGDLKQLPRWVDGSGLSRYNLFTPESMVAVLHKMYRDLPRERLLMLFPQWASSDAALGKNGLPIYAKSGSLSNNYCLSGYLVTSTGRFLIFSFMNNHFNRPTAEIKKEMEAFLRQIIVTH